MIQNRLRPADDYQPRVQLRKEFEKGILVSNDAINMRKFSEKYIVDEMYVKEYLVHLEQLKLEREKRRENVQKARETEAERGYEKYNLVEFWENGELKNKTNKILQKYIEHHKLRTFKTKRERIASIAAHISRQLPSSYQTALAPDREIQ